MTSLLVKYKFQSQNIKMVKPQGQTIYTNMHH